MAHPIRAKGIPSNLVGMREYIKNTDFLIVVRKSAFYKKKSELTKTSPFLQTLGLDLSTKLVHESHNAFLSGFMGQTSLCLS